MYSMKIVICKDPEQLGFQAATLAAQILNKTIAEKGNARLLLSTGASQFETLKYLVKMDVDWSKVEMFHLDEYIGIPRTHPASFRRYLEERFVNLTNLKRAHYVDVEGDLEKRIQEITDEVRKQPIDLALVGVGENAHIAFNDPPADFETKEAFIIVNLDERCKQQQVREGWFKNVDEVPKQAVTMTVYQIMQSRIIMSCVPHKEKANAVKLTLENDLTNKIPATMLKQHPDWTLFLDEDSASLLDRELLKKYLQ